MEPPVDHCALSFAFSSAVGACEEFELGVESAFEAVGGVFPGGGVECGFGWGEIGK